MPNTRYCNLAYNELEHWLQSDCEGHLDPLTIWRETAAQLYHAVFPPCLCLLSNHEWLRGPWAAGLDVLLDSWLPHAERLGLRYVAYLAPAHSHAGMQPEHGRGPLPFELQVFHDGDDARHWLRQQRDAARAARC